MTNKPRIDLFLLIGLIMLVSVNLMGCLPVPKPVVTTTPILTPNKSVTETFTPDPSLIPAFPGAEGFGAVTVGGRGGRVIEVTNLNDAGPDSLRAAVEAEGSRIVVFRLAGTIGLESSLVITNPYITIAGQTAPGEGITLRDVSSVVDAIMLIETHDVVIRYSHSTRRSTISG